MSDPGFTIGFFGGLWRLFAAGCVLLAIIELNPF